MAFLGGYVSFLEGTYLKKKIVLWWKLLFFFTWSLDLQGRSCLKISCLCVFQEVDVWFHCDGPVHSILWVSFGLVKHTRNTLEHVELLHTLATSCYHIIAPPLEVGFLFTPPAWLASGRREVDYRRFLRRFDVAVNKEKWVAFLQL